MPVLSELLKLHDELDGMFFEHQSALLHFKFDRAGRALDRYEHALLRHMRDEEKVLMPVYVERAAFDKAGHPQLFLDEHEKMRKFVELFRKATADLAEDGSPEAGMIILLDREAFYKRLCSHHDIREKRYLYPELDRVTTAGEKNDLLEMVTRVLPNYRVAKV